MHAQLMPDTETTTLEAVAIVRAYRYRGSIHVNCHDGLEAAGLMPGVRSLAYEVLPDRELLVATGLDEQVDGRSRDDARSLRRKVNSTDTWSSTDAIIPFDYFERAFGDAFGVDEKENLPSTQETGFALAVYAAEGVLAFAPTPKIDIPTELHTDA